MSLKFTALTVREGDAFLLEDDGWKCLFDSGRDESIVDLLKFKGIDKLDLAICSHNDADHANGFIALLNSGFQIKEIWLPGLWASVLHFINDNCKNAGEVELDEEVFNGELDSLFTEKSVSEDSFNQDLSFGEDENREGIQDFCARLHSKLACHMVENPYYSGFWDRTLRKQIFEEYHNMVEKEKDYFEKVLWDYDPWDDDHIINLYDYRNELMRRFHHRWKRFELTPRNIKRSLDLKLENILSIATLAKQHNCTIRWFEPSSSCLKEEIDHGFISLNSSWTCSIRMPKSGMAYMYLLSLTKENKYSLVFEYTKNGVPIIRFSADSDSTCQSIFPYPGNIIVTAPHHGSAANANVYKTIRGNDLIWVRSDKQTKLRPCLAFKNCNNKYCLACKTNNFISEICFIYNPALKKWDCVKGEQCRC